MMNGVIQATLTRIRNVGPNGEHGTQCEFSCPDVSFACVAQELGWHDNAPDLSRMPVGRYLTTVSWSEHFKRPLYHIQCDSRQALEIHNGNFTGYTPSGWKSDVLGCVILGDSFGEETPEGFDRPQACVLNSKATLDAFMVALGGKPMQLTVLDQFEVVS